MLASLLQAPVFDFQIQIMISKKPSAELGAYFASCSLFKIQECCLLVFRLIGGIM